MKSSILICLFFVKNPKKKTYIKMTEFITKIAVVYLVRHLCVQLDLKKINIKIPHFFKQMLF